jgi:hypothetical protein
MKHAYPFAISVCSEVQQLGKEISECRFLPISLLSERSPGDTSLPINLMLAFGLASTLAMRNALELRSSDQSHPAVAHSILSIAAIRRKLFVLTSFHFSERYAIIIAHNPAVITRER